MMEPWIYPFIIKQIIIVIITISAIVSYIAFDMLKNVAATFYFNSILNHKQYLTRLFLHISFEICKAKNFYSS